MIILATNRVLLHAAGCGHTSKAVILYYIINNHNHNNVMICNFGVEGESAGAGGGDFPTFGDSSLGFPQS